MGDANSGSFERYLEARLAQHVVSRRRERRRRRPAQDKPLAAALEEEGDVRLPVADPLRRDWSRAEAVGVEKPRDCLWLYEGPVQLSRSFARAREARRAIA